MLRKTLLSRKNISLFCTAFIATFLFRQIASDPFWSSGTNAFFNSMNPNTKNELIVKSARINQLILDVIAKESTKSLRNSNPDKITSERQEIHASYMEIADLIERNSLYLETKMSALTEEIVNGLKSSAAVALLPNSSLYELRIGNTNFFSLGMSELTNAMSPISRERLLEKSTELNQIVIKANKKNANISNKSIYETDEYKKATKIYLDLADILSDDLRNIQINNPRIAPFARSQISGFRGMAAASNETRYDLFEYHPESIRYQY
jgi:hypothetical protein